MGHIRKAVIKKHSATSSGLTRGHLAQTRRLIPASEHLNPKQAPPSNLDLQTQLEKTEKLGHHLADISISSEVSLQKTSKTEQDSIHIPNCGCPVCNGASLNLQRSPLFNNTLESSTLTQAQAANISPLTSSNSEQQLVSNKINPRIQRGLWGKIKKGVKKVGGAIKKGATKVGSAIKKGATKVGSAIKKGAKAIWTGTKWVSQKLWEKLKGIYFRLERWITQLPNRIGRLLLHIWEGVKSLKPWSLKWWESLGQASTWKGVLKWLGTVLIDVLETAGIGEIYETLTDFIKFNTRPLSGSEIAKAKEVFGSAINYSLVRVDEHALLGPSWTGRAYVSFHTINNWGTLDDHTLIHELTHVWQYEQMGAIYMPKAIHAQGTPEGYNYTTKDLEDRRKAGQKFRSFNLEQQGQILADYYIGKTTKTFDQNTLDLYEYFVKDVRK